MARLFVSFSLPFFDNVMLPNCLLNYNVFTRPTPTTRYSTVPLVFFFVDWRILIFWKLTIFNFALSNARYPIPTLGRNRSRTRARTVHWESTQDLIVHAPPCTRQLKKKCRTLLHWQVQLILFYQIKVVLQHVSQSSLWIPTWFPSIQFRTSCKSFRWTTYYVYIFLFTSTFINSFKQYSRLWEV